MAIYSFNKDMFPSLLAQDLVPGYNSIGFADLSSVESEVLGGFIGLLGDPIGKELDESNVLLVKADNAGIVTQVYGASIFKGESGLVLKVGNNEFLVSQANGGFEVGALIGEIAFSDKPVEAVVKDEAGEERRIDLYPATVNFLFAPEGDEDNAIEYQVRCSWDASTEPKPAAIKAKIRANKDISDYFRGVPTGTGSGVETGKMQDLGVGEFEVIEARSVNTELYGIRFVLKLANGQEVWSRGNADIQLKDRHDYGQPLLRSGVPTFLIISEAKQRKDGKWSVTCTLRERKAIDDVEPAKRPVKFRLSTDANPPATPVAAGVGAGTPDYDDIPF